MSQSNKNDFDPNRYRFQLNHSNGPFRVDVARSRRSMKSRFGGTLWNAFRSSSFPPNADHRSPSQPNILGSDKAMTFLVIKMEPWRIFSWVQTTGHFAQGKQPLRTFFMASFDAFLSLLIKPQIYPCFASRVPVVRQNTPATIQNIPCRGTLSLHVWLATVKLFASPTIGANDRQPKVEAPLLLLQGPAERPSSSHLGRYLLLTSSCLFKVAHCHVFPRVAFQKHHHFEEKRDNALEGHACESTCKVKLGAHENGSFPLSDHILKISSATTLFAETGGDSMEGQEYSKTPRNEDIYLGCGLQGWP
ncbi:hypothetical protein H6P81_007682 [Aristolochia fimbriata]|uniref:Uncharacterized protein n=1 Tax=Aristolochia fimbriata TaxID=158543 RepID=A0AAV7F160_ARIFI|nr:hypothetical protein H6P81_007682 [Aristolochia fimbriata]